MLLLLCCPLQVLETDECMISSSDLDALMLALKTFCEHKGCTDLRLKLSQWATKFNNHMKMAELTSLLEKWMNASKGSSASTSVAFNGERALALLPKEVKGSDAEVLKSVGVQALPLLMENVLVQARHVESM